MMRSSAGAANGKPSHKIHGRRQPCTRSVTESSPPIPQEGLLSQPVAETLTGWKTEQAQGALLKRCTLINDAALALLGYSQEQCLGQNMHKLIHHHPPDGADYPEKDCPIFRARELPHSARIDEEVFWRKDRSSLPVDFSFAHQALGEKASELERSSEDLSQFAAITGHDLQTPLRTINTYAELIAREYGCNLDEDGRQYLNFITTAAPQYANPDLRSARIYALRRAERDGTVVLNKLMENVREVLRPVIEETEGVLGDGISPVEAPPRFRYRRNGTRSGGLLQDHRKPWRPNLGRVQIG